MPKFNNIKGGLKIFFYNYGSGYYRIEHPTNQTKIKFYLKCVNECLNTQDQKEILINNYGEVLKNTEEYLHKIIQVVFEDKDVENRFEYYSAFSTLINAMDINDIPRAKEILEDITCDIHKLRQDSMKVSIRTEEIVKRVGSSREKPIVMMCEA